MAHAVCTCAEHSEAAQPATAGKKQLREHVASVKMRKGVWSRYGSEQLPERTHVALRLLSMHPTSASTEQNWALWGRVYTGARNALGLERATKLITFCYHQQPGARSQHGGLCIALVCCGGRGSRCYKWAGVIDAGLCASVYEWQQGCIGAVPRQQRGDLGTY
jgi:hypothetical protein